LPLASEAASQKRRRSGQRVRAGVRVGAEMDAASRGGPRHVGTNAHRRVRSVEVVVGARIQLELDWTRGVRRALHEAATGFGRRPIVGLALEDQEGCGARDVGGAGGNQTTWK